jgi:hypothetical protein
VTPQVRTSLLIASAAVAVFVVGALTGYAIGRSGGEEVAAPRSPVANPSTVVSALPPTVETPSPGQAPAIGTEGRVLAEGTLVVVTVAPDVQCAAHHPGPGECMRYPSPGNRVVWAVEFAHDRRPARFIRVFTFVSDERGWSSGPCRGPGRERWTDVGVVARDLTTVSRSRVAFQVRRHRPVSDVVVLEAGSSVVAHMPDADHARRSRPRASICTRDGIRRTSRRAARRCSRGSRSPSSTGSSG